MQRPPPDCRRTMIRLRSGIKARSDRRPTSTGEVPGERTRESALDTSPPVNRAAAVWSVEGIGGAHGPQPGVRCPARMRCTRPGTTDRRRVRPQSACPLRARSAGQRRVHAVTPGQPHARAHLRTCRLTRCANRPSKLVIVPSSAITHPGLPNPGPAAVWIAWPARPR